MPTSVITAGNWSNAAGAGVFNRNWNNNRSNNSNNYGFRASDYLSIPDIPNGKTGDIGSAPSCRLAKYAGLCVSVPLGTIHMPKRIGRLFDQCFTLEALFAAYETARRGKRKTGAVLRFERDLGANLQALHDELHAGTYAPQPYRRFEVIRNKPRTINAPAFRDVIVQHAIYAVIQPIFDRSFIYDSHGCRKAKGTHSASDRAQRFLRQSPEGSYTLQLDIRRFYYRIDRFILRRLVARKIKDQRLLNLMMRFAEHDEPLGVPIGNLLSQIYALIVLNPLDHFIKRVLKIKRYVRYVDDFILFGLTREQACEARDRIRAWLADNLRLEFSRWTIAPVSRGVNFVGFRTWRRLRFVRKRSMHSFSKSLRRGDIRSLNSIMGHAAATATLAHFNRRIAAERRDLITQLPLYEVRHAHSV
jgi:retron-type reverse transcriptase|tara:strand:+ start:2328 stop:3578 length:1251 start_codon:yes stop_codon:yes gene_type:complete